MLDRRTTPANATTAVPEEKEMEQLELSDQVVTSQTLLKLAGHLGHLEAEKLAVHLYVDYCHIAALRQQYPDDPEMYAYKLLMKWWETSDDSDQEQWDLLVGALRSSGLGNLAVALVVNNNQGLSDQFLMDHVSGLTHRQAEHMAISLGVKQTHLDPLLALYPADPQLFAYHALRKWRDSCELSGEEARQALAMAIMSLPQPTANRPRSSHLGYRLSSVSTDSSVTVLSADGVELDGPISRRRQRYLLLSSEENQEHEHNLRIEQRLRLYQTRGNTQACECLCSRAIVCCFVVSSIVLVIVAAVVALLLLLFVVPAPSSPYYFIVGTFVFPVTPSSFWFHSFALQTGEGECLGKAVVVPCNDLEPNFSWFNSSENKMYLTEGSKIHFYFRVSDEAASYHYQVWVFSDHSSYEDMVNSGTGSKKFNCAHPSPKDYCLEITLDIDREVVVPINKRGHYYVACFPDGERCANLDYSWKFYVGGYNYNSYIGTRPVYSIQHEGGDTIILQDYFQFDLSEHCVLVNTHMEISPCHADGTSHSMSAVNFVRRLDLLLFPLLGAVVAVVISSVSLVFCARFLWKRRRRDVMGIEETEDMMMLGDSAENDETEHT